MKVNLEKKMNRLIFSVLVLSVVGCGSHAGVKKDDAGVGGAAATAEAVVSAAPTASAVASTVAVVSAAASASAAPAASASASAK